MSTPPAQFYPAPETSPAAYAPLPPPPEGGANGGPPVASADELMRSLQTHAAAHGYALTRKNAANYRDGKPTRYTISCDRGKKRESRSKGLRRVSTRLDGCEFQGVIKALKVDDWKWTFELKNGLHNHGPSEGKAAHAVHRRLSKEQKILVQALAKHHVKPAAILETLQEYYPDVAVKPKDINNIIQLRKTKAPEGQGTPKSTGEVPATVDNSMLDPAMKNSVVDNSISQNTMVQNCLVQITMIQNSMVGDLVMENTAAENNMVGIPTVEHTAVDTQIVGSPVMENIAIEDSMTENAVMQNTQVENGGGHYLA